MEVHDECLFVLVFTGVPIVRLSFLPCAGRWDELYRTLLLIKLHRSRVCNVIVLLEVAKEGKHCGVASLLIDRVGLDRLNACDEHLFVSTVMPRWVSDICIVEETAPAALSVSLESLFGSRKVYTNVLLSCFASPDDDVVKNLSGRDICSPGSLGKDCDLVVKVFGSPCHWAHSIEIERMPLLVEVLEKRFSCVCKIFHVGMVRLRASTCMLVSDGVSPVQKSLKVPRVLFDLTLEEPMSCDRAAAYLHHFLVEIFWTEQRRNQPRHHVFLNWFDVDELKHRKASITSLQIENLRGDPVLKAKRKAEFRIKET